MAEDSTQKLSDSAGKASRPVHVGRRTVLGILGLAGVGIVVGKRIDTALGSVSSAVSNAIGVPLPGDQDFRFYTVTGSDPVIPADTYELTVAGMVREPLRLSLADLRSMRRTSLVHQFQCVTGWVVPDVHWEGVRLSDVLDRAGVKPEATALRLILPTASTPRASRSPRPGSPTSSWPTRCSPPTSPPTTVVPSGCTSLPCTATSRSSG